MMAFEFVGGDVLPIVVYLSVEKSVSAHATKLPFFWRPKHASLATNLLEFWQ
jgi:hypothetical protein